MTKPSEAFHGGRPTPAGDIRRRSKGASSEGEVFHVATAAATNAYGGDLRIPVHPLAGSVSAMSISYKLEAGEKSREFSLSMSESSLCVIQGAGRIRIGEEEHGFAVGDLAFVPVQGRFVIQNSGDEPLVVVGLISPPDPDMLRAAGLWPE